MVIKVGLLRNDTTGALVTTTTAATIAQSFQKNGRAVAADFSLYVATAPAEGAKAATDFVKQGYLMRADNVMYFTTIMPSGSFYSNGIRKRSDGVMCCTSSPNGAVRTQFDPLIGQVQIDQDGRVIIQ